MNRVIENIWNTAMITGSLWLVAGLWVLGAVCVVSVLLTIILPLPDNF